MGLIGSYNLRSMVVRKGTAAMTAMGIAMVVAVFVMTLSIAQGFRSTLVASGSPDNAILMRKGATSENVSAVLKPQVPLLEAMPQVARGDRRPRRWRRPSSSSSSRCRARRTTIRRTSRRAASGRKAFEIRNTLQIRRGPPLHAGTPRDQRRQAGGRPLQGADPWQRREVRQRQTWKVVGIFTADDASFESEVWGDVDLMMPAFQRNGYQSATVKLTDPSAFESPSRRRWPPIRGSICKPQRERDYYEGQSEPRRRR